MSLILPPSNSPLRELFAMSHLAELPDAVRAGKLMGLEQYMLMSFLEDCNGAPVVSVNVIASLDGNIVLARISANSAEVLWNFGAVSQFE